MRYYNLAKVNRMQSQNMTLYFGHYIKILTTENFYRGTPEICLCTDRLQEYKFYQK
jgi:hypothetical protein